MKTEVSVYLDAVRFLAAIVVVLTHLSMLGNHWLWWALPYGTEAVLVFFVLSGFVIGYVTENRERTATDYAVNRAARIYSVSLPALATTALVDFLLPLISRRFHFAMAGRSAGVVAWQFLSNALFVSQFWHAHIYPGSDFVFWSLSYEVTYYVAFGVAVFGPARYRLIGAAAVLIAAGPRIASLFPIWLLGVACYRLLCHRPAVLSQAMGWSLFIGPLLAWSLFEIWATRHGLRDAATLVALYDHSGWLLIQDYGLALLFAINLVGLNAIADDLSPVLHRIARPVRWIAGATFSLYLFHLPVSELLLGLLWNPVWSREAQFATFVGMLIVVFAIAEVTERRKEWWRRGFLLIGGSAKQMWYSAMKTRQ